MFDIFSAVLLADHLSRRHFEDWHRPDRKPPLLPEPESPWARVFAWHRRGLRP